ncbi:hypothetical protein FRC06_007849, partial [Ceratobasidium sp. 370]
VMHGFQKKMLTTVCEWGRTTGAAIYIAAMFDGEETGLQFVDACSANIIAYQDSPQCSTFRDEFSKFVCDILGKYYDGLLNVSIFQDPSSMCSLEVRDWFQTISRNPNQFQFAKVTRHDGTVIKVYSMPCLRRHPDSRLVWTPEAILFARNVEEEKARITGVTEKWKHLPVARTLGVYQPFTEAQKALISRYSTPKTDLNALVDIAEQLETFSGAHVNEMHPLQPNPHMPQDLRTASL